MFLIINFITSVNKLVNFLIQILKVTYRMFYEYVLTSFDIFIKTNKKYILSDYAHKHVYETNIVM